MRGRNGWSSRVFGGRGGKGFLGRGGEKGVVAVEDDVMERM